MVRLEFLGSVGFASTGLQGPEYFNPKRRVVSQVPGRIQKVEPPKRTPYCCFAIFRRSSGDRLCGSSQISGFTRPLTALRTAPPARSASRLAGCMPDKHMGAQECHVIGPSRMAPGLRQKKLATKLDFTAMFTSRCLGEERVVNLKPHIGQTQTLNRELTL